MPTTNGQLAPNPQCEETPRGDCYPSSDLGLEPRVGNVPGNTVPNLAFFGYVPGARGRDIQQADPTQIHLGDFFDPSGQDIRLLHVSVQYAWCGPSHEEEDFIQSIAQSYAPLGVRFLTILTQGVGVGERATINDLQNWITEHRSQTFEAVDTVTNSLLDTDGPAAPFNMVIDTRSMEIFSTELGFSTSLSTEIDSALAWVAANPPKL